MATIKAKTKIGGIEDLFSPEIFFGLLGWTDRKFSKELIRFKISDTQHFVLETLGGGIYCGDNINDVARAALCLGTIIEVTQKARQPRIVREVLSAVKLRLGSNLKARATRIIDELNFDSAKVQEDLKMMLEQHGDNDLGEYVARTVEPLLPYSWNINHQPKFRDIKRLASRVKWGVIPLDDEKRFELKRNPENHLIGFKCTKRINTLVKSIRKEFYHLPHAKVCRGMFIKGLHVLAKWYQANNKVVADWYSMNSLLEQLDMLHCKDYR